MKRGSRFPRFTRFPPSLQSPSSTTASPLPQLSRPSGRHLGAKGGIPISMRSLLAAALLVIVGSPARGQAVGDRRFDPVTGDYYVMVMNDSLQPVELRVVPPNKVLAALAIKIERGQLGPFRYGYTVRVRKGTRQPLAYLEIDCPDSSAVNGLTATAAQNGISTRWNDDLVEFDRPRCEFSYRGKGLTAGGTLEAVLETVLLPTIGEVRLFGSTPGVSWPTSDPIDENEPARPVVYSVSGLDGGWKSVPAPVPGRDPATMTDLAAGLVILENDLDRACGELGWITSTAVCSSLRNVLQQATPSVTRGNDLRARARLESFLAELAAQHNAAGTLPVKDAAFWLLRTNAEFVLTMLARPRR